MKRAAADRVSEQRAANTVTPVPPQDRIASLSLSLSWFMAGEPFLLIDFDEVPDYEEDEENENQDCRVPVGHLFSPTPHP